MGGSDIVIAVFMVVTGSVNTISTKLADVTKSENIHGERTKFKHPFFQAVGMFMGEMLCLLAFKYMVWRAREERDKAKMQTLLPTATDSETGADLTSSQTEAEELLSTHPDFSPWYFFPAAMCDMTATSLMYLGLTYTYASVFQMLRGAVVIFTGLGSVFFLKRKLYAFHWTGMLLVLAGLLLVGLASIIGPHDSDNATHPLLGDIIIVCAQVIVAVQMVYEERVLTRFKVPALKAVGLEGCFGFTVLSCLLVVFYYIPGDATGDKLENAPDAMVQVKNSWVVAAAMAGNVISIALFNYSGITITKRISATTRMVLDSVRTVVIWGFSLIVGWQKFFWLQAIGFVILLLGTLVYNKLVIIPIDCLRPPEEPEKQLLKGKLPLQPDAHVVQFNGKSKKSVSGETGDSSYQKLPAEGEPTQ